ncbi:hypothetical protein DB30_04381 [Enhygromyxa salina]|uniref:Polyketide cyclase / dehydrase and lipid transport n=2 Tax=Enhygromyxa salina TaxID=215803 RepID=A0A0C1ZZ01_9BACT|nr:hypothetical protein DB30_04381 [Enhygromyxa salina]
MALHLATLLSSSLAATGCAHDAALPKGQVIEYEASAEIDAPPELVWATLVEFQAYAQWNPWLVEAEQLGPLEPGAGVNAKVRLGDEPLRTAKHRVVRVEAPAVLCWRDAGWQVGLVQAQRCRFLEARADGGTSLRVTLTLGGAARGMAVRKYGAAMSEGLASETAALAAEAERRAGAPP